MLAAEGLLKPLFIAGEDTPVTSRLGDTPGLCLMTSLSALLMSRLSPLDGVGLPGLLVKDTTGGRLVG